ncbi:MAG TPA: tetratricopeptide repeat protein [Pirellulaceae bacterium]|nr:tetratricopeptide repeat protein [Pirellulaceae bacterium]
MNVTESTPNAIDLLAEEFVERFRRGERPAVSEYEARFPEQAEAIRDLFPALVIMENLKPHCAPVPTTGQAECASEVASLGRLGDYRIVREVGRGGMGIVYEAVQESLGRQVALKVLPKQLLGDPSRQSRFDREARAAARLHHTNIVPVFGVGEENGLHYYAMQYIHGLGLDEVLRELKRLKSPSQDQPAEQKECESPAEEPQRRAVSVTVTQALLKGQFDVNPQETDNNPTQAAPPLTRRASEGKDTVTVRLSDTARLSESFTLPGLQEAGPGTGRNTKTLWQSIARIGTQVGAALHYAHEQAVLHRDIKPSNLLLDTRGTVWVTDFGLAKADDQRDLTNTGDVLGTLRYMAPEMFSGQADRRSDVYSLGLTLYELLALRPAFDEADRGRLIRLVLHESPPRLRTLDPAIPRDLETIIHKAIDREASHRYPSAQDLADDLQRFLDDEPIRARRISPITRFNRWCKRNPAVASLTSAIAILLLVATGVSLATAMTFQQMASHNSKLAGDLKTALGDAEKNLTQVKVKEQLAQTNLGLATAEQQRAEGNLDLALKAMDAVYLEAIGTEKLLGAAVLNRPGESLSRQRAPLSDLEKQLLQRGLSFYDEFAKQNASTPKAAVQTAQAYFRVGLLHKGLEDSEAADAAYRKAIERFEKLTKEEPSNADHYFALGYAYESLAHSPKWRPAMKDVFLKSADALSAGLRLNPQNAPVLLRRARVYEATNELERAIKDYERAVEIKPDDPSYHLALATILCNAQDFKLRDYPRSLEHARRAAELDPKSADPHCLMGAIYEGMLRDYEQAMHALERALALVPDNRWALVIRGRVYWKTKKYQLALADFDRSLAMGGDSLAYRGRAQVYVALGEADKAYADWNKAQELFPEDLYIFEERGQFYISQKRYNEAINDLDKAVALAPARLWSRMPRALAYFRLSRFPESLADLRKVWELYPQDWKMSISPAEIAKCSDEEFKSGLLKLADEAVAKNPNERSQRAVIAMHLGRWKMAREDMAELMKVGSVNYSSHYQLAMLSLADKNQEQNRNACRAMLAQFAESKIAEELNFTVWTAALAPQALDDYGPAIALARRGVELNKDNPEAIRSLGAILYRAGKFDEAAQQLAPLAAKAEKSNPEAKTSSAYPLFFLAMAQHQLGKKDEARATLQKAAELAKAELSDDKNPPPWNRKLTLELLQKEAEGLIGSP